MTPYFSDDWLTVYQGDARVVLPELASDSVDCIVTSPPYWGLRDYGTDGQLGLEPTPELYVANLVGVFRELRRVLKPSGTCWLNLGSSYMNSGPSGPQGKTGQRASRTFTAEGLGSGALCGSGPSRSRGRGRAPAYGSDGTAPADSTAPGSAYPDLCDGCRADLSSRRPRSAGTGAHPSDASPPEPTARDTGPGDSELDALGVSPLDAQASTSPQSEQPPPGECSHCDNCGACLSVLRSVGRDARLCVRRSAYNHGRAPLGPTSAGRTGDKESSGEAWGHYTSTLKPKDMVPIPWLVAMALQADGWYLRSDIIWSKPNPMPESVTDRPTKAHEYLFLLTKSARYFFDQEAVREASIYPDRTGTNPLHSEIASGNGHDRGRRGVPIESNPAGRNLRSVWTIATRPYPGAHFAVFPPELPERCIKAGSSGRGVCPECGTPWEWLTKGEQPICPHQRSANAGMAEALSSMSLPAVILDPFAGSGTVGLVANRLSRRAILIDLNADYLRQQMQRNAQTPLGLGVA